MWVWSSRIVFGPIPGMRVSSTMGGGNWTRSSTTFAMLPVSRYSLIRAAIPLPMPGTAVSSASVIVSTGRARSATAWTPDS